MYSPCVTSGYSVGQQRPPFNVVCLRHLTSLNISADIPISISLITRKIFLVLYSLLYVWFANSKKILKNSHFKIYSPILPLCSFNYFMALRIKNYSAHYSLTTRKGSDKAQKFLGLPGGGKLGKGKASFKI